MLGESQASAGAFDPNCSRCARLAAHLESLRERYPDYHNAPVPAFGDADARLLIVGLAPGMHGANATGRPFTGDFAGILLYKSLFAAGFANRPESAAAGDGLVLRACRITNAVKCLPPQNRPTAEEVNCCNAYLRAELSDFRPDGVILALGTIAHRAVVRSFGLKLTSFPFAHGAEHAMPSGTTLIDSYHCSRYNTQTGRLTGDMFSAVLEQARRRLEART
jgi:uracil-DNA glycosylase family 4